MANYRGDDGGGENSQRKQYKIFSNSILIKPFSFIKERVIASGALKHHTQTAAV